MLRRRACGDCYKAAMCYIHRCSFMVLQYWNHLKLKSQVTPRWTCDFRVIREVKKVNNSPCHFVLNIFTIIFEETCCIMWLVISCLYMHTHTSTCADELLCKAHIISCWPFLLIILSDCGVWPICNNISCCKVFAFGRIRQEKVM